MTEVVAPVRTTGALQAVRAHAWIAGWWLAGRVLVVATAVGVHLAGGPTGYLGPDVRARALGLLEGWDGRWYRMVAAHGYLLVPGRQSDPAFFPLYPLLLRAGGALGLGTRSVGLVVSNVALLVALAAFAALTREYFDDALARRATVYVALFPLGYVFSMEYPESIVLAAICLAALAALRRRWLLAALCAAAAALARPEGVFVALPLAATAWSQRQTASPAQRGLALGAVAAPLAALASFPLYLGTALGDPLAWSRAEEAWGRRFRPFGFVDTVRRLPDAVAHSAWTLRDAGALLLFLVLLAAAVRAGAPRAWVLAGAAVVLLPLESGSFDSIGRFGLLAPAVFWGLAAVVPGRRPDRALRVAFAALLVAATVTVPLAFP